MIKILIFVVVVLALGGGFAWLADRPGDLVITWQGQQIEMSLMVGVSLVVALIVAILLGWWLIRTIWTSPHLVRRHLRARKRDRGYQALSTGLIAAGAGDAVTARKMSKRTRGLISARQEPLIHLLEAQTSLIEGDHAAARSKFESMAEDPETRDLALRGLYLEARRLGEEEAARHFAEKAVEAAPQLPWAAQATLEFRSREGDWDGALRLLEKQRMARVVKREDADRNKAVLLTARAMQRLDGDSQGARDDALEALRLAPDLVPAAVTAAKALFREDNLRKGSKILEKVWKAEPHPEVASTYVRARIGDSALDRLKRAEKLEALKPNNIESLAAVGHAALDAQQFERARAKAEAAARLGSRESIYLLLADIEEAETGDQGRVRHWLGQAVRAGRDPAWTADGYVSEKWAAVSPVTGKLDAFVWRVPVAAINGSVEEGSTAGKQAEQAIKTLPPLAQKARPTDVADDKPVTVEAEIVTATRHDEISDSDERKDVAARASYSAPRPASEAGEKPTVPPRTDAVVMPKERAAAKDSARKAEANGLAMPIDTDAEADADRVSKPAGDEDGPQAVTVDAVDPTRPKKDTPFMRPPDDPGVESADPTPSRNAKPRFRLF